MNNPKFISFAESGIDFIDGDRGTNYPSKSELIANGYCVFLNTGNVKKTGFDFTQVEFIDEEKDKKLRKGKVKQGDIVLTTRGTVGNVALVTSDTPFKNIRINSGMVIVRTDPEKYDPYFILLFFRSSLFQKQCLSHGSGSAQPQLPISALKHISFPDIDIDHQRKVVSAASCIDKKIEINNRINAELEAMAKTLYDYWFVQFDFPDAKGNPYKTTGGKMVYNPTLKREIPAGWSDKTLSQIANITMGQSPEGSSYNEEGVGTIFYQGSTDFGWLFPSTRQYTTEPNRMAKKGDILLSVRAPVGDMNIANTDCCIGRGLAALNSKTGSDGFLFYVMKYFKQIFDRRNSEGTTFGSITKDGLYSLTLTYPTPDLLKRYDGVVTNYNKMIFERSLENRELTSLRDWLLPMLMNCQVTVR